VQTSNDAGKTYLAKYEIRETVANTTRDFAPGAEIAGCWTDAHRHEYAYPVNLFE